jgi:hypothetical protein
MANSPLSTPTISMLASFKKTQCKILNDASRKAVKNIIQLAEGFCYCAFNPSFLPLPTSISPPATIVD